MAGGPAVSRFFARPQPSRRVPAGCFFVRGRRAAQPYICAQRIMWDRVGIDHSSCGRSAPWSVYMIDTCFAGLQVVVNSSLGSLSFLDLVRYFSAFYMPCALHTS